MIVVKDEITLPEANTEQSTFEESRISNEQHLFGLKIEEDEEEISGDHHANESCIEHRFQVSIRLDQFCFCFYFVNLHLQFEYIRFHFVKLYVNILLLLLHVWFH